MMIGWFAQRWKMVPFICFFISFCLVEGVQISLRGERNLLTNENILSSFYVSTNGESWNIKTNWLDGSPCPSGEWYGVSCAGPDVNSLALFSNTLAGSIPSEIGLLTSITVLEIQKNSLTGSLPSQLGLMSLMSESFQMYTNLLTGPIPSQLGKMSLLTSDFNLNSNLLSGPIPSEIGLVTKLQTGLNFNENRLNGSIPSQLGLCTSLVAAFKLYSNSLVGPIPSELGNFVSFEGGFHFYTNQLSGLLPSQLGRMSTLKSGYRLDSNSFTGNLPSQLGLLSLMTSSFYFNSNSLSGSLPSEFGLMTGFVRALLFNSNKLSGSLPSQIGQLSMLTTSLYLYANTFTGALPSEIAQMTGMASEFQLYQNNFTGSLPSQLGNLVSLTSDFNLYSNRFSGSIPSQLGRMTKLNSKFQLHDNRLSVSIPSQIGQISKLTTFFDLSSNRLCDDLPSEVVALSSLVMSDVDIATGNSLGSVCCETLAWVTCDPTPVPTSFFAPTKVPTPLPTTSPTNTPTSKPTVVPTLAPTTHCESGTYYDGATCTDCAIGRYTTFDSAPFPTSCTLCSSGQYNTQVGSSECIACANGKLSSSDRTYCEDCQAGEYSFNGTSCVECERGRYAPQALTDSCLVCTAGFFTNNGTKATSCSACDAGKYSNGSSDTCSSCSNGRYSSSAASECSPCSSGFFTDQIGSSSCTACSAGRYVGKTGARNCSSCDLGKYQGSTGQSLCEDCDSGKHAQSLGSSSCSNCAAGKYIDQTGAVNCTVCPIGKSQGTTGQSECDDCYHGTYAAEVESTSCDTCPLKYNSRTGSSSCPLAASTYYLAPDATDSTDPSTDCPPHASCLGGRETPIPDKRYWVDHSDVKYMAEIYRCARDTCDGGSNDNTSCWDINHFNASECHLPGLQCKEGAGGVLCNSCIDGYVYSGVTNACRPCEAAQDFLIIVVICVLVVVLLVLLYFQLGDRFDFASSGPVQFAKNLDVGSLKVIWVTYQIVVSSSFTLGITYPPPFDQMLGWLSIFSLDFLALECLDEGDAAYYKSVYIWCIGPIVISVGVVISGLVRFVREGFGSTSATHANKNRIKNQHFWMLLLLSYMVLPAVSNKQLQVFDCISLKSGKQYLRSDTAISCTSASYLEFRAIVTMFIVLYQLIPVVWFVLLFYQRHALNPPTSNHDNRLAMFIRDNNSDLASLRFLFVDYRCTKWWFEIADMYRRIVFVGVIPLVSPRPEIRASFGLVLAILSVSYFREAKPYRVQFTNVIAHVAQFSILITFYCALSISSGVMVTFGLSGVRLGIFLVCLNFAILLLAFQFAWSRFKLEQKARELKELKVSSNEDTRSFSKEKYKTTFASIWLHSIPSSHAMVFHYTSVDLAKYARKAGIPAQKRFRGVPLSLRQPLMTADNDFEVFQRQGMTVKKRIFPDEEVLVLSLPRNFLDPLPGYEHDEDLCMISAEMLNSLRPPTFTAVIDSQPWLDGMTLLPPPCIIRSFLIMDAEPSDFDDSGFMRDTPLARTLEVVPLFTINTFTDAMKEIRDLASSHNLVPLYHYTSPTVATLIINSGLRMSSQGQGDGGVYFSTQGPALYGLGTEEYELNIIRDCFGVERVDEYKGLAKLDAIIVYGCSPSNLHQAPGGRDNAKVVSKSTFGGFSMENSSGTFFLRPDRILGAFEVDQTRLPALTAGTTSLIDAEKVKEKFVLGPLDKAEKKHQANILRIGKSVDNLWSDAAESSRRDGETIRGAGARDAPWAKVKRVSQIALNAKKFGIKKKTDEPTPMDYDMEMALPLSQELPQKPNVGAMGTTL